MATLRGQGSTFDIGNKPPTGIWTIVRGDTSGFKVYVTDDAKVPLVISEWTISMKIKRPNNQSDLGVITDDSTVVLTLSPGAEPSDGPGEFTVWLAASDSVLLRTGDIFDVQLSDPTRVWTVCQGSVVVLEDVTD